MAGITLAPPRQTSRSSASVRCTAAPSRRSRTASFDEALGIPTQEAARTSIRANQIIGYESGVPDTVDPLGGSYYVEHLTLSFEREIEAIIREVDAMGGALAAVHGGYYQRALSKGAYREACAIESGEQVVVGVNRFQTGAEAHRELLRVDESVQVAQVANLASVRAQRDASRAAALLGQIEQAARDPNAPLMSLFVEAVQEYVTLGEICGALRRVFGEYQASTLV